MSQVPIDETTFPNSLIKGTDTKAKEYIAKNEDEDTWPYDDNSRTIESVDNTTAPSIDEITRQEINARETAIGTSAVRKQFNDDEDDDDDDDDRVQVIIRDYEPETVNFQPNREKSRGILSGNSAAIPPKQSLTKGVDCELQGVINGQATYDFDITKAYKDEDKPWKKIGADITEYFNYGFTEDTWIQYCDRQRRLRHEINLPRHNNFGPIAPGHLPMAHPMMMMNKPMNMQMIQRPMNNPRISDGKINVIGTTDKTTRRVIYDGSSNFEQSSYFAGPPFIADPSPNGPTIGDRMSTQTTTNNPSLVHGTQSGNTHHMPPMTMHRLPMMPLPHGMPYRTQFGHMHVHGGLPFLPQGSHIGMRGDRPPQQFFLPPHPRQPWDKAGVPMLHGFPPRTMMPLFTKPETNQNERVTSSRSLTPENRSVHSPTPEENRTNVVDNEKLSKDTQFKERYNNDRDHHSSSSPRRRRSSSKDHSSASFHSRHRTREEEYERPRNEKRSSRDRDDRYENSRKRSHRDNSNRHGRSDHESSRSRDSRTRTPTKSESSPLKLNVTPTQSSQRSNEETSSSTQVSSSSSSPPRTSRSHRDNSEHISSRHNHHKKSSKRSRHDSDDERNSNNDHRRVKDKLNTNSKISTNQTEYLTNVKD